MKNYLFIIILLSFISEFSIAEPKPKQQWITHPSASIRDYGVFHFRKTFELNSKPEKFIINVSADNRYKLFVNGTQVSLGPARGDLGNWRYEQLDIAPYLNPGKNVLASIVWNLAENMPLAQISYETAFVLWGNTKQEEIVSTNESWKVLKNNGYHPIRFEKSDPKMLWQFYVSGASDSIVGRDFPWGWETINYDDSAWLNSRNISIHDYIWQLSKSKLPQMENKFQRFVEVRRTQGVKPGQGFLLGKEALVIPANTKATILIDQKILTTAYPKILVSQGNKSEITIRYAEALFNENTALKTYKIEKGNRNNIEGGKIYGLYDKFYPDGNKNRLFETLWFRTFRYVELEIKTNAEPLTIEDIYSNFTGYPYSEDGNFISDDTSLKNIWDVGWRTLRLCSQESFVDCPYYEQMQYIADARIEALVALHGSKDDRLVRNAISLINDSRLPNGLARSTYPSQWQRGGRSMSLYAVCMLYDYWMLRNDSGFVRQFIPLIRDILEASEPKISKNGLVENIDFIDTFYKQKLRDSIGSAATTLLYCYAFDHGSLLLEHFGKKEDAIHFRQLSEKSKKAVYDLCYNSENKMFADLPDKKNYSQHTNILAILTNTIEPENQASLMQKILADTSLDQVTSYYRFYLGRAMKKSGLGDQYVNNLQPWNNMIKDGLSTFSEWEKNPRSDCHAWSSSPNIELLATVCGIESAEPGFKSVRIEPALGRLKFAQATMPHPNGEIKVLFRRNGKNKIDAEITLPAQVTGKFIWEGTEQILHPGFQKLKL